MLLGYEQSWKRIKEATRLSIEGSKAKLVGLTTYKDGARSKYYCGDIQKVIDEVNRPSIPEKAKGEVSLRRSTIEKIQQIGMPLRRI